MSYKRNSPQPVVEGGTGAQTFTSHGLLIGQATSAISALTAASTGTVLTGVTGSDPAFSATPSVTSITISNAPVAGTDGTNKSYVDLVAAGFTFEITAVAGTTANLSATYNNGAAGVGATLTNNSTQAAFSVDGVSPALNDRILVKDQSSQLENGIYTLTVVGSGASNWVLTRATDYDQAPSEIKPGSVVPVSSGTANANTTWLETAIVNVVGTDPIVFSLFTGGSLSTFHTDSGNATVVSNAITIAGGTGINTSGSGATVTVNLSTPVSIANGGTNASSMATTDGTVYYDGASLVTTATGTSGWVLTSGGAGVAPAYAAPAASSISITGDSGGAIVGNAFIFAGGSTGLSFGGSGTTETLTFAGITANGGTVSLATDATTSTINVGTGAGVKTSTFGSTNSTSATTLQSGSGALALTSTNGTWTGNSGTGALGLSTDATNTTISLGTGAGVKAVTLGSTNTSSSTIINSGSGGIKAIGVASVAVANKNYVTINTSTGALGSDSGTTSSISITGDTGGALTGSAFTFSGGTTGLSFGGATSTETLTFAGITANGGTVSLATDATTSTINVGTGAGVKTSTFGSTNSTSATTVQSGSGALALTSTNGTWTGNSGTGALGLSTDATNTTISLGTGAGVKTVTLGSATSTSSLALNFGGSSGSQLNTYVTGSFTPALNFSGGTTGISYAAQTGSYTRIGNVVYFTLDLELSNKGSSTGNAAITGLPYGAAGTNVFALSATLLTFSGMVNARLPGGSTFSFDQWASGGARTQLTNTAFANGTFIQITGCYGV